MRPPEAFGDRDAGEETTSGVTSYRPRGQGDRVEQGRTGQSVPDGPRRHGTIVERRGTGNDTFLDGPPLTPDPVPVDTVVGPSSTPPSFSRRV